MDDRIKAIMERMELEKRVAVAGDTWVVRLARNTWTCDRCKEVIPRRRLYLQERIPADAGYLVRRGTVKIERVHVACAELPEPAVERPMRKIRI